MKLQITSDPGLLDALAVVCFEQNEQETEPASPEVAAQGAWLSDLRASGEFTGKLYETVSLHRPQSVSAKRLVLIGGGKSEKFGTAEARRVAGVLVRTLKSKGVKKIGLSLSSTMNTARYAQAIAEGAVAGTWEPGKYKSEQKADGNEVEEFLLLGRAAEGSSSSLEAGRIIAESQNFARDLINEPGNRLTPAVLAQHARDVAATYKLESQILDTAAMKDLKMGALLGVAQGSANPPFLIVLKYRPENPVNSDHLALVGKGVTFDTGGVSIKSADGMEKMKYDMAGAGAVLGAMRAIAQVKPRTAVTAYIPTVENAVGGNAQRPGDIVATMSGKTVEVINTDAEGRLILADAVTYAKRDGATHIVDAATLTGAIGVALGHHNAGAFTNNPEFLEKLFGAARVAGEKMWQLPMDEEYKDYLKSAVADLPNVGGRYGGSITAAWFIREFADPTPWIHLDIASTAWLDDGRPWLAKGPSGVALRTFVELASSWKS
ncbi:MAG TPA: leucyl aminopeptidase [Bryobacteraceae bacterium]|jgi:leucyl aminopeptidase